MKQLPSVQKLSMGGITMQQPIQLTIYNSEKVSAKIGFVSNGRVIASYRERTP
jgi:hypothetical protein